MASKFRPKVHPLKHWDHDQGLRMMHWLCLSFCFVFVVEWDLPARCEGAFVMKTIMPFTFGRQPIGLLESRQRSSLKIISKLFCVGLISNFPKAQNPEQLAHSPRLISLYMNKKPALAHRGRLRVNLYSLPTGRCFRSLWSTETFCERFGRSLRFFFNLVGFLCHALNVTEVIVTSIGVERVKGRGGLLVKATKPKPVQLGHDRALVKESYM